MVFWVSVWEGGQGDERHDPTDASDRSPLDGVDVYWSASCDMLDANFNGWRLHCGLVRVFARVQLLDSQDVQPSKATFY